MITLTPRLLQDAVGCTARLADEYCDLLNQTLRDFSITTVDDLAMFLAQLGHESGSFQHNVELWGPTPAQLRYERDFLQPWPKDRAEARRPEFERNRLAFNLGNSEQGDGSRFKGHGLIQNTGRYNHRLRTMRLRSRYGYNEVPDFEMTPEELSRKPWSVLSAGDYWVQHGLSELAHDIDAATRKINGGLNGIEDRRKRWERAKAALARAADSQIDIPIPETKEEEGVTVVPPSEEPETSWRAPSGEADILFPESPIKENATMGTISTVIGTALSAFNPIAGALFGALAPLVQQKIEKEVGRHTDNPEIVKTVATGLLDAAKKITGQSDDLQAVAVAQRDPAVLARVETDVLANLERALPLIERINALEQANIRSAREYNSAEPYFIDTPWVKMKFVNFLSLGMTAFAGWFAHAHWAELSEGMRGSIVTLMVIGGWNGTRDYWMGSSNGSDRKTTELMKSSRQG